MPPIRGWAEAGTGGAHPPCVPVLPVLIAGLALGVFVATLRLGRPV